MSKKKPARTVKRTRVTRPSLVTLDTRATIVQAAGLHNMLLSRIASGAPVVIDAAAVEEIDTAILQLLASLRRTCEQRGIACSWSGVSEAVRRAANVIGVAEMLHFPECASAQDRRDAAA